MVNKWQQGGDWHIRRQDGTAVNLNTSLGAAYVLELQQRLAELAQKRRRRKPGPSENKQRS